MQFTTVEFKANSQVLVAVLAQIPCRRISGSTQLAAVVVAADASELAGLNVLEMESVAGALDVPLKIKSE